MKGFESEEGSEIIVHYGQLFVIRISYRREHLTGIKTIVMKNVKLISAFFSFNPRMQK